MTQGDGRLPGMVASTTVATDGNGDVTVPFQMGNESSRLTATIPGTDQTVSIDFTPPAPATPDSFQRVRNEGIISLSFSTDPEGAVVSPGMTLPIRVEPPPTPGLRWEGSRGDEKRNYEQ